VSWSLAAACEKFDTHPRKLRVAHHGQITPDYIRYARGDPAATAGLLQGLRAEFDRHPLGIAPWEVHSPATFAKATLGQMGITPLQRRGP
jgi:hypothetical protein